MRASLFYKRTFSLLAALAFAAVPMLRESGQVLCFGSDGHVQVEEMNDGHHTDQPGSASGDIQQNEATASVGAPVGVCVDIPLVTARSGLARRSGLTVGAAPDSHHAAATRGNPVSIRPEPAPVTLAAQSLAATRASALVRSVVRLI